MNTTDKTIGEIVAEDYRTATVFEKHGLDFCCGGKVVLAGACAAKGIDLPTITRELDALKSAPVERSLNYAAWELAFLADYIVNAYSDEIGHTFRLKPATIPSETRPDRSEATLRLFRQ